MFGFINQQRFRPPLLLSLVSAHSMRAMADALACYADGGPLSKRCAATVAEKHKAMPGVPCH